MIKNLQLYERDFTKIDADQDINHGDAVSPEYFLETNPDYLFILNKHMAVGEEGATTKSKF